jgi:hypothetical protein
MPMKEQQPDGWRVPCSRYEGRPWLYREVILTPEGIGAKLAVYPATIVQARYNGSYEGAPGCVSPCLPASSWSHTDSAGTAMRSSARGSGEQPEYKDGLSAVGQPRQPPMTTSSTRRAHV